MSTAFHRLMEVIPMETTSSPTPQPKPHINESSTAAIIAIVLVVVGVIIAVAISIYYFKFVRPTLHNANVQNRNNQQPRSEVRFVTVNTEEPHTDVHSIIDRERLQEMKHFLRECSLSEQSVDEYARLLLINGYDDLNVIKTLTDKDLIEIGVQKKGHRQKILSRLYDSNTVTLF